MARSRYLNKSIATDECVGQLSEQSQLLFDRCIPFQDNEGRMPGEPGAVRELAVPLLPWSNDLVEALISEWELTVKPGGVPSPLVIRYPLDASCRWRDHELGIEFECRLALEFRGFVKNQPRFLRRGAPSSLPPPAADQQCRTAAVHGSNGPAPRAQSVRARVRGLGSPTRDGSVGGASKLAASPPVPEQIVWLAGEAERCFGRTMVPLKPTQIAAACAAVDRLGRDAVGQLIAEKAASGLEPKSLAYFMPALQEATPTFGRQPVGGMSTGDLIDLSQRLKEERLASG